jgi:hypothetical protein
LLFGADRHGEHLARPRDVGGAAATGQQPVVPDAVEAPGQHVHQEASDELVGRQRHGLIAARPLDPVILPPEGDAGVVGCDQAAIGDGDPVGVARQIGEHGPGAAERPFGIDHPIDLAQRRQMRRERLRVGESGVIAEELQVAGLVCGKEPLQEQPPEQAESTRTGRKKPGRHATQRSPSGEMPPPGTIMWTCG